VSWVPVASGEQLSGRMVAAADSSGTVGDGPGSCARRADQVGDALEWRAGQRHQHVLVHGALGDGREIPDRIVGYLA